MGPRQTMHDTDPLKCPSCTRLLQHVGWKERAGTTLEDWDHYECGIHECRHCKLWWIDKLGESSPLVPVRIGSLKCMQPRNKRKR